MVREVSVELFCSGVFADLLTICNSEVSEVGMDETPTQDPEHVVCSDTDSVSDTVMAPDWLKGTRLTAYFAARHGH